MSLNNQRQVRDASVHAFNLVETCREGGAMEQDPQVTIERMKGATLFPDATEANWNQAERIVLERPSDGLVERVALALGAAWRDGCATGMREQAEEAAEIIKASGPADQRILDRLAEHVRGELWSDEEPD
jgi:hypothetical protein